MDAYLSTPPDSFCMMHHFFSLPSRFSAADLPDDSIDLTGMIMGEVREGVLYFAPGEEQGYTEMPDEPFTILWYGPDRLELPMDLSVSR